MDGNIKDTPPVIPVPRTEDRPRFDATRQGTGSGSRETDRPQDGSEARIRQVARRPPHPASVLEQEPARRVCKFHAPLTRAKARRSHFAVDGKSRETAIGDGYGWGRRTAMPARRLR